MQLTRCNPGLNRLLKWFGIACLLVLAVSPGLILRYLHDHHDHQRIAAAEQMPIHTDYIGRAIPNVGKLLVATTNGKGDGDTKVFSVSGNWNVYFEFGAERDDAPTNFSVAVHSANGQSMLSDKPSSIVNQTSGFGTLQYHSSGKQYLVIKAPPDCLWAVTVKTD